MGCIGCAVILHEDEARSFADVHLLAHFGAHMAGSAVQRLDGGLGAVGTVLPSLINLLNHRYSQIKNVFAPYILTCNLLINLIPAQFKI